MFWLIIYNWFTCALVWLGKSTKSKTDTKRVMTDIQIKKNRFMKVVFFIVLKWRYIKWAFASVREWHWESVEQLSHTAFHYWYFQIPADSLREFRVTGLAPGERYVFAVAAYTANGTLIGGAIGASTKPILASHPMSLLMAWNYLCQVKMLEFFYCIISILSDCFIIL